jgi:hypothetical protein
MMDETPDIDFEDPDAMARARERLRAKGFNSSPRARRARETKVRNTVDGRSLRATGRTEQFNFKSKPGIKRAVQEAANKSGLTIAEWMESVLVQHLGIEGE